MDTAMEWLMFAILVLFAAGLLLRGVRTRGERLAAGLLVACAFFAGIPYWNFAVSRADQSRRHLERVTPRQGGPEGYVSSDNCRACHPKAYDSWHQTYHRTMTQWASRETVAGDFNNVRLELAGRSFVMQKRGEEFGAEMDATEGMPADVAAQVRGGRVWRRLGLLTGSHHMQAYWVQGDNGNKQSLFPFAWLIQDRRWVPFHSTFLRDPAQGPASQTWNLNCINCHATAGQGRPNYQTYQFETRVGELGIACEACHGPAEDHTRQHRNVLERYVSHFSSGKEATLVNPSKLSSKASSQVCGQCHSIHWIPNSRDHQQNGFRYRPGQDLATNAPVVQPTRLAQQPWLKEPLKKNTTFIRDRYWPDGMVRVSGREYNGLIESPCFKRGELSCLSCHSMHQGQSSDDQLGARMEGNQACLQCHQSIGAKLAQHTHHLEGSSGSLCYNCHMPHTTYGLLKSIRSHQIDSPDLKTTLATGRPNACNLCHLDQTLGWTGQHLSEWYGQPSVGLTEEQRSVAASVLWLLKGDAGQRALMAWSLGWDSAQRASGSTWMAPYLAQLMQDPYSAVRFIAGRSSKTLGPDFQSIAYDFVGPETDRTLAAQKVMETWQKGLAQKPSTNRPAILMSEGRLQKETIERLLKERNTISIDLQE